MQDPNAKKIYIQIIHIMNILLLHCRPFMIL